jgi:hypothetical protein
MLVRFFLGSTQTVAQFVAAELFLLTGQKLRIIVPLERWEWVDPPQGHKKAFDENTAGHYSHCSLTLILERQFCASGTCAGMDTGPGADLNGFVPFPADNAWNTDISSMPVDPNSDNIIAFIGASSQLHPDFGAGLYEGSKIGIPYQVVDTTTQPKVPIRILAYKTESDPGPDACSAKCSHRGLSKSR